MNQTLARATFLDPRFRKLGFSSKSAFGNVRDKVTSSLANKLTVTDSAGARESNMQQNHLAPTAADLTDDDLIWGDFDRSFSSVVVTPTASAILEVRQFVEEPNIGRHEDPLGWWNSRIGSDGETIFVYGCDVRPKRKGILEERTVNIRKT